MRESRSLTMRTDVAVVSLSPAAFSSEQDGTISDDDSSDDKSEFGSHAGFESTRNHLKLRKQLIVRSRWDTSGRGSRALNCQHRRHYYLRRLLSNSHIG